MPKEIWPEDQRKPTVQQSSRRCSINNENSQKNIAFSSGMQNILYAPEKTNRLSEPAEQYRKKIAQKLAKPEPKQETFSEPDAFFSILQTLHETFEDEDSEIRNGYILDLYRLQKASFDTSHLQSEMTLLDLVFSNSKGREIPFLKLQTSLINWGSYMEKGTYFIRLLPLNEKQFENLKKMLMCLKLLKEPSISTMQPYHTLERTAQRALAIAYPFTGAQPPDSDALSMQDTYKNTLTIYQNLLNTIEFYAKQESGIDQQTVKEVINRYYEIDASHLASQDVLFLQMIFTPVYNELKKALLLYQNLIRRDIDINCLWSAYRFLCDNHTPHEYSSPLVFQHFLQPPKAVMTFINMIHENSHYSTKELFSIKDAILHQQDLMIEYKLFLIGYVEAIGEKYFPNATIAKALESYSESTNNILEEKEKASRAFESLKNELTQRFSSIAPTKPATLIALLLKHLQHYQWQLSSWKSNIYLSKFKKLPVQWGQIYHNWLLSRYSANHSYFTFDKLFTSFSEKITDAPQEATAALTLFFKSFIKHQPATQENFFLHLYAILIKAVQVDRLDPKALDKVDADFNLLHRIYVGDIKEASATLEPNSLLWMYLCKLHRPDTRYNKIERTEWLDLFHAYKKEFPGTDFSFSWKAWDSVISNEPCTVTVTAADKSKASIVRHAISSLYLRTQKVLFENALVDCIATNCSAARSEPPGLPALDLEL